jgi:hypothetical protein
VKENASELIVRMLTDRARAMTQSLAALAKAGRRDND